MAHISSNTPIEVFFSETLVPQVSPVWAAFSWKSAGNIIFLSNATQP